jgi:hypothetical protein
MKKEIVILVFVLIIVIPAIVYAENGDLASYFTRTEANTRLTQIRSSLTSFKNLTNLVYLKSNLKKDYKINSFDENKIPLKAKISINMLGNELKNVGNQGWEVQNIGFANWPKYVEGYIEYLELKNMKLQLELAQKANAGADKIKALKELISKKEAYIKKKFMGEVVD